MSEQPSISTTHFSRILIELGRYIQKINLDRIIDGLEAEKIIYSPTAQELRKIDDEFDKSNIVTGMMQGRKEKDFKTFLKIIAAEKPGSKFYDATREFFSGFWQFQGYDKYANWPNGKSVMHFEYYGANVPPVHRVMHCHATDGPPTNGTIYGNICYHRYGPAGLSMAAMDGPVRGPVGLSTAP